MRLPGFFFVVVIAAACGDGGSNQPDAPPTPDAPPDGGSQLVTLTIVEREAPRAGVLVLFQAADGALVSRTATNAQGVASAVMAAGGFVTAVDPFSGADRDELRTFAGVKPGDELRLEEPAGAGEPVDVNVIVRPDPNPAVVSYRLRTPCGTHDITGGGEGGLPGGPVTLSGCGRKIDVIVDAIDAAGVARDSLFQADVVVASGGMINVAGSSFLPNIDARLTYMNIPAAFSGLDFIRRLDGANGNVFQEEASVDLAAGAAATTLRSPDFGTLVGSTLTTLRGPVDATTIHRVIDWGPPAGSYAVDGADLILHEFASRPAFDAARRGFAWTVTPHAAPDFVLAVAAFARGETTWNWHIAAPYADALVAFPVLPGDEAAFNPIEGDDAELGALTLGKAAGGYDAIRELLLTTQSNVRVLGPSGRLISAELAGDGPAPSFGRRR